MLAANKPQLLEYWEIHEKFPWRRDLELVQLVDRMCDKTGKDVFDIQGNNFMPTKRQTVHFKTLETASVHDLQVTRPFLQITGYPPPFVGSFGFV